MRKMIRKWLVGDEIDRLNASLESCRIDQYRRLMHDVLTIQKQVMFLGAKLDGLMSAYKEGIPNPQNVTPTETPLSEMSREKDL